MTYLPDWVSGRAVVLLGADNAIKVTAGVSAAVCDGSCNLRTGVIFPQNRYICSCSKMSKCSFKCFSSTCMQKRNTPWKPPWQKSCTEFVACDRSNPWKHALYWFLKWFPFPLHWGLFSVPVVFRQEMCKGNPCPNLFCGCGSRVLFWSQSCQILSGLSSLSPCPTWPTTEKHFHSS